MSELQISEIWNQINQILQLDYGRFNLKLLCTREWYLQVLEIIFPDLSQSFEKLQEIQSEEAAIDRMLILLTQYDIIQQDFLEIKGVNIVNGHKESIFYVVQLFMALVEKAIEQPEEGEQGEEQYQEEFDEQQQKEQKKRAFQQDVANYKAQMLNMNKKPNNVQYSDKQDERQRHSVQGIGHQFDQQQHQDQEDEEEEEEEEEKFQNQHKNHNEQAYKNVFPQNEKSQLKQSKQTDNIYNNNQEDEGYEGEQNYLKQKLQKHKSQQHFKNIDKKKSPKQSKMHETQKVRKLVSHPHIPKKYPKAGSDQEKKLTSDVKKVIKNSRKKGQSQNNGIHKVTSAEHLDKKRRQLNQYVSNTKKAVKNDERNKRTAALKLKNQQKLKRLLKWKQANLRRQKQELEQDMEMKVQLKKQLYIKKINKLILNLEKNRMIEKKKQERERQKREKELANKRLQAIQQQYKTQMKLLHEKSDEKLGKKTFVSTDHRQIIQGLQRQLKKENQKQLINLKMKFRREQAQLQDDLQKLQSEIIKTYKRN